MSEIKISPIHYPTYRSRKDDPLYSAAFPDNTIVLTIEVQKYMYARNELALTVRENGIKIKTISVLVEKKGIPLPENDLFVTPIRSKFGNETFAQWLIRIGLVEIKKYCEKQDAYSTYKIKDFYANKIKLNQNFEI